MYNTRQRQDHHHHHHHFICQKYRYIKTRKKNTAGKTYQAQRALTVALGNRLHNLQITVAHASWNKIKNEFKMMTKLCYFAFSLSKDENIFRRASAGIIHFALRTRNFYLHRV